MDEDIFAPKLIKLNLALHHLYVCIYIYIHIPDICIYIYTHINASFPLSLFRVVSATFLLKPVLLLHEILNLFSCAPRDCKPYKGPVVHLRFLLHIFQEIYPKGLKEIWHFESSILLKSLLEKKLCQLGVILPQDGTGRFHWLQCLFLEASKPQRYAAGSGSLDMFIFNGRDSGVRVKYGVKSGRIHVIHGNHMLGAKWARHVDQVDLVVVKIHNLQFGLWKSMRQVAGSDISR